MRKELQNKLYKKYPAIFAQKDLSIKKTCMCWGIDCGDGWYWLIDNLCRSLQSYIDHKKCEQLEATQVKEKFGRLRFYTTPIDDFLRGQIRFAEHLSLSICEECGSTEDVAQTTESSIKTRCKKCLEIENL